MSEHLNHPRCVAIGEIGFNNITENEEKALVRQLGIAKDRGRLVAIHLPHNNKRRGAERIVALLREVGNKPQTVILDHKVICTSTIFDTENQASSNIAYSVTDTAYVYVTSPLCLRPLSKY